MLTVHLRINDAATGKPTPVRLRVSNPDGTFFPSLGRFAEFPCGRSEAVGGHLRLGREAWIVIDGSCEIALPAGVPLRVRATKGPEFLPLDETITLGPGQMSLRFAVERWSDVRSRGWHPGDSRCHAIAPHAALLEAAAEDLDVVNLLAAVQPIASLDGTAYPVAPDLLAFSGQAPALESHGRMVAVNTLNVHPVLGRVGLLYSHRPVFPLVFGGPDATDDWSVCDWCDQCHRKGGLTTWVEAFRTDAGGGWGEALVAAVLGKIDAIEYDPQPRRVPLLPHYYRLLNAGFHIPLVGGSGKDSNRTPLGSPRTYARIPPGEPPTYKAWIEAVRAGRTFVTNGPLLSLEVEDVGPGETLDLPAPRPIRIRASAEGLPPEARLEVIANGQVVSPADTTASCSFELTPPDSGWVAARVTGGTSPLVPEQPTFAHTSPVRVRVGSGQSSRRNDDAATLRRSIEQTRAWLEAEGRFADPRSRQKLLGLCADALALLTAD